MVLIDPSLGNVCIPLHQTEKLYYRSFQKTKSIHPPQPQFYKPCVSNKPFRSVSCFSETDSQLQNDVPIRFFSVQVWVNFLAIQTMHSISVRSGCSTVFSCHLH
ncbi:hypothetical protein HanRHA438_Chr11g0508131 [Helianthus annuus]|nr:hypothetical protein HanIR_Chr11g0533521 [Helianthus annuus]KAJ0871084.1 hypothetical protein HanRHA438_Chr11g0508131 [Helianthus annuus]